MIIIRLMVLGTAGTKSEIIALGESWAYHMGHFLSDRKYALNSSPAFTQRIQYTNNSPLTGFSSHINLLEDFNTDRTSDPADGYHRGCIMI